MSIRIAVISLLLGACTDTKLSLHAGGIEVLAIQKPGEAWQGIPIDPAGEAVTSVPDGPFVVASVCDQPGFFDYYADFVGPGIDELDVACVPSGAVKVSIAPGPTSVRVAVGPYPLYEGDDWNIAPGTYDVFAYDPMLSPPRFELRRGVSITQDTVLSFDLSTTGTSLTPIEVRTDAMPTEQVSSTARFFSSGGARITIRVPGGTWRVPVSAMTADDHQTVTAQATLGDAFRSATKEIDSDWSVALTLPVGVASATAESWRRVSWQSAGIWTTAHYSAMSADYGVNFDGVVHREWIDAKGPLAPLEIPDPTSIPGWQPTWTQTGIPPQWFLVLDQSRSKYDVDEAGWTQELATGRRASARMPRRPAL